MALRHMNGVRLGVLVSDSNCEGFDWGEFSLQLEEPRLMNLPLSSAGVPLAAIFITTCDCDCQFTLYQSAAGSISLYGLPSLEGKSRWA